MSNSETNTEEFDQAKATRSRKKGFALLAVVVFIAAVSYGSYWYLVASHFVATENAYVDAETAQVTPAVSGIVEKVNVIDTQMVKKGDILVELDDTDAQIALSQAQADLALAKRRVQGYIASDEGFSAMVNARQADENRASAELASAQAAYDSAKIDLQRRENLLESGSVSGEEVTKARSAFQQAQAKLNAVKAAEAQAKANRLSTIGQKKANQAKIAGSSVESNPEVLAAKARLEQAKINLDRTVIRAPISGVVAKRQVQVGRRVQVGSSLMTIVPIDRVHVNANFKEVDLTHVKIGQPVEVVSDLYGDDVVYKGVVSGISGGTGAAFALIPAQNATGNWIKVVQRLPVRVELDPTQLAEHPLQVGLSMTVTIDTDANVDESTISQYRQVSAQQND
ncbi:MULTISPECIES: HlyD family secretion protein [unclassified Vibrio]|uniref:HlyD family secretion protein n=1 Tax=Vibrio sp. HB236076 TaxID=3232307 RepID=A0AB39HHR8_9VIBR|nr:HlyD family secretion protein [Vibrio sp. HB161653]MDP5255071.1 HlyD family secretion protein [Vibrio sp. HB161653]